MKKCKKCKQEYPATKEYFYTDRTMKDDLRSYCKKCSIEYSIDSNNKKYIENYNKLLEYEGGSFVCSKCGYTYKNFAPFEYHHINKEDKKFMIGNKLWVSKFDNWKDELNRCVLLCSNCHKIEHFNDNLFEEYMNV